MKYFANFRANNGTRLINPIEGSNKKKIITRIREIAEGERTSTGDCSWSVWDASGACVANGGMMQNGMRWRDNAYVGHKIFDYDE